MSVPIYSWIRTTRLSARDFPTTFQRQWMPSPRSLPTMDGRGAMPPHPLLLRATLSREASGSVQSHTRGQQQSLLRMPVQDEMGRKGRTRSRRHWRASAAAASESCLTRLRQRGPLEQGHSPELRTAGPLAPFGRCRRAEWRPMRDSEGAVLPVGVGCLHLSTGKLPAPVPGRCVCMVDQF